MARFVLITGKIGAGKSFVAEMLRKKHYTVIDSDSLAKHIYNEPEMFQVVVSRLGPMCLTEEGKLDFDYMRKYLLTHNPDNNANFAWALATRLTSKIQNEYGNSKEIVFIEAAPTRQIGKMIRWLQIKDAIVVSEDDEVRHKRLMSTRNMSAGTIDAFDNIQSIDNIYTSFFPGFIPKVERTGIKTYELPNCEDANELNTRLMEIIERNIQPTADEKYALYERYLKESPEYCKANAMCYSFYNMGGCNSCPFPCTQRDPDFKEANKRFKAEHSANKL